MAEEDKALQQEHAMHKDMVFIPNVDSYRNLPQKVKEAYAWASKNTKAAWFAKVDDDMFVRIEALSKHLQAEYSSQKPTLIGHIVEAGTHVTRQGKWAEFQEYTNDAYPAWPQGSYGHIVSRPVAEYIAEKKDSLFNGQGEDTSMGIWMDVMAQEASVTLINSDRFVNDRNCLNTDNLIVGHDLTAGDMVRCKRRGGKGLALNAVNRGGWDGGWSSYRRRRTWV